MLRLQTFEAEGPVRVCEPSGQFAEDQGGVGLNHEGSVGAVAARQGENWFLGGKNNLSYCAGLWSEISHST